MTCKERAIIFRFATPEQRDALFNLTIALDIYNDMASRMTTNVSSTRAATRVVLAARAFRRITGISFQANAAQDVIDIFVAWLLAEPGEDWKAQLKEDLRSFFTPEYH